MYFATNASYSASDRYTKPEEDGLKHMYLCKVLTGEYTIGKPDLLQPPLKDQNRTGVRYDCVVNNTINTKVWVIFSDTQAYPEYLIYFN